MASLFSLVTAANDLPIGLSSQPELEHVGDVNMSNAMAVQELWVASNAQGATC